MRTLATEEDIERVAEFNATIHGPTSAAFTRSLLLDYPDMEPADQVFVERADGTIVSALCLIPWVWKCEETSLPAGEMAIVGTSEEYRKRGLVRAQVAYFQRRLRERGCVLSHIQGIPYFYRQFGYEYALPLEGGYRLEFRHIPTAEQTSFALRKARIDDVALLAALYERAVDGLCIHTGRSTEVWQYLLTRENEADDMYHDTWIVEGRAGKDGEPLGYMRTPRFHFGDEFVVDEAYAVRHDVAQFILTCVRDLAQSSDRPAIRLNLPASSYLVRLAKAHGATFLGAYSWQIQIPDDAVLLQAMKPVLEQRLASSHFIGWSGALRISFYTRALSMKFERGRLHEVQHTSSADECGARMPHAAFVPLVTGDRSFEELRTQYPDIGAEGVWMLLIDTLFPKRDSFLYTAY